VDRLLDRTEQTVSVGVRQLCCREGTNARSFARGRETLRYTAQIETGEELFRVLVESEGKAVLKASAQEQLELDWSASQCMVQRPDGQPTTRIYVSADGVLVPTITQEEKDKRRAKVMERRAQMPRKRRGQLKRLGAVKKGTDQRYKQVYETTLFDQNQEHRLVGVSCQGTPGLKRLLRRESARVRLRGAAERLGVVDGAVCLRNHLEELPLLAILLDFYHLSEHVGGAKVKTLGEKGKAGDQWLAEVLHTVRHEGYKPFFQKLMDWRSGLRGQKREAADGLINYVALRQEMIRYEECERQGWHVGSGTMESMCGVTTDRIKGRGRRWDLDNAEAMMALEALYQSTGLWDKYWSNALLQRN
jgi:dsDNA-binding SOS-regulon protein